MRAAGSSGTDRKTEHGKEHGSDLSSGMQMLLSMGFSYMQAIEAYSIFGDDVDSMVCYLLETGSSSRRKGKATEWHAIKSNKYLVFELQPNQLNKCIKLLTL